MSFSPLSNDELQAHLDEVSIFPLPGVVFLPSSLLPLHVFEPRYRDLLRDALSGQGLVCVPRLHDGWQEDYAGAPPVHEIAGIGQVVRHQTLPDGRLNVILVGLARIRLVEELSSAHRYRTFRGELCAQQQPPATQLSRLCDEVAAMSASMIHVDPELAGALARVAEGRADHIRYIDTVAHLLLDSADDRQVYLELDDVEQRVAHVQSALAGLLVPSAEIDA